MCNDVLNKRSMLKEYARMPKVLLGKKERTSEIPKIVLEQKKVCQSA